MSKSPNYRKILLQIVGFLLILWGLSHHYGFTADENRVFERRRAETSGALEQGTRHLHVSGPPRLFPVQVYRPLADP